MTEKPTENGSVEPAATTGKEQDDATQSAAAAQPIEAVRPNRGQPRPQARWWLQSLVNTGIFVAAGLLLIVGVGIAQRVGWISAGGGGGDGQAQQASGTPGVVYVCPMMCTTTRSQTPDRCPVCGMELAPVSAGGGDTDELSVEISPAARRVANIATVPARSANVERSIRTIGRIAFDESRQATISAYVDGRIEELFADYTGVYVTEGDHMVVLYSPELYAAQVEYVVSQESAERSKAKSAVSAMQRRLLEDTHEKLRELGMTEAQLVELKKSRRAQTRLGICAPIGGTVIEKLRDEGDYVKTGDPIYRIADLSVVWLMLELFPEDASQVRYGQKAEAVVQSLPGEVFTGRVAFIDPVVDEKTRTVGVRVEILNPDNRLRPGDYASAKVKVPVMAAGGVYDAQLAGKWISPRHPQIVRDAPGRCPLSHIALISTSQLGYASQPVEKEGLIVVPRDAVLMAGDNSVLYVETEPGRFEIRPIVLGPLTETEAVILAGVKEGEQVATSGNFLIDSQMQLAGNPSLIDPTRAIEQMAKRKESGPLEFGDVQPALAAGETGAALDELFEAYFTVQKALAGDKSPEAAPAEALRSAAGRLQSTDDLPDSANTHVEAIAKSAEGLHEIEIKAAREQFKPISHAVIHLATQVRGPQSMRSFVHFYCSMVEGGGGDWLQAGGKIANPYFGSQMLRCGKKVHEFVVQGRTAQTAPTIKGPGDGVKRTANRDATSRAK